MVPLVTYAFWPTVWRRSTQSSWSLTPSTSTSTSRIDDSVSSHLFMRFQRPLAMKPSGYDL